MMGYLNQKTTYLCGSMHAVSDDGVKWREYITPILMERFGVIVSDPSKRSSFSNRIETKDDKQYFKSLIKEKEFVKLKDEFYPIVRKDLKEVDKADFLIVHYDPGLHIFGTIHEMIIASNEKKPILVKYDEKKLDDINPWLFTLIKANWAFSRWEDMFLYLDEINRNNLDTSHWW